MACLLSFVIVGTVVLLHDYPGHSHWEFLHDVIQGKAVDDSSDAIRISATGEAGEAIFDGSLYFLGISVSLFAIFIKSEFEVKSNDGMRNVGMRSPPCCTILTQDLFSPDSPSRHVECITEYACPSIFSVSQTIGNDNWLRYLVTGGSNNNETCFDRQ